MSDSTRRCDSKFRWPQPGELWSLWDMLRTYAHHALVWGKATSKGVAVSKRLIEAKQSADASKIGALEKDFADLEEAMSAIGGKEGPIDALRLPSVIAQSERVDRLMARGGTSVEEIMASLQELGNRVEDDLRAQKFLHVPPTRVGYYEAEVPFGIDVDFVFPTAREDLLEGSKCFAVARYTASVFHIMRALEAAVFVWAGKLNVKRIDKNGGHRSWGQLLPAIKTKIESRKSGKKKDELLKAFFLLAAANRAYRVDISHGNSELRPKQTYTEEQAKECFDATRSFMVYLADVLSK